jgi:hypothetical protein
MQNDDNPPSPASRGGFAGQRQRQAADDILAAQAAVEAALPVGLMPAVPPESESGVVVHFTYKADGYVMRGDISRGTAGLAITRVEVSAPTSAGVTLRLLRSAPLGELLAAVRAHMALEEARRRGTGAFLGEEPAPGVFTEDANQIPHTSGRTQMTDDLLRKVATAYLDETGPGKDRRAIQRLAGRFGRPEGTVRTWVGRARKEGWLGPGAKGRMGAEAGPKLIAWIGDTMMSTESVFNEASRIGKALGITTGGPIKSAVRAYGDSAERDLTHRMSLPPLEGCVAAQAVFGQTVCAELADRKGRTGATEESALAEIAAELRQALDQAVTEPR